MNRRSLLSLVAASTGLLCGARSPQAHLLLDINSASWDRRPEFDADRNPTGFRAVYSTMQATGATAMALPVGDVPPGEWPDGLVARSVLANCGVPNLPPGMKRAGIKLSVGANQIEAIMRYIYVNYTEVPI